METMENFPLEVNVVFYFYSSSGNNFRYPVTRRTTLEYNLQEEHRTVQTTIDWLVNGFLEPNAKIIASKAYVLENYLFFVIHKEQCDFTVSNFVEEFKQWSPGANKMIVVADVLIELPGTNNNHVIVDGVVQAICQLDMNPDNFIVGISVFITFISVSGTNKQANEERHFTIPDFLREHNSLRTVFESCSDGVEFFGSKARVKWSSKFVQPETHEFIEIMPSVVDFTTMYQFVSDFRLRHPNEKKLMIIVKNVFKIA